MVEEKDSGCIGHMRCQCEALLKRTIVLKKFSVNQFLKRKIKVVLAHVLCKGRIHSMSHMTHFEKTFLDIVFFMPYQAQSCDLIP